ncbi:FAD/NAD(P)-binding domain-containing protein [Hyaloscypha variabilis F]|uniref:FAD/NAD(P)-binding domain-containing protein n=1 Tax=Hyaloscypha variabilis (strain UAMH 11265 / GT02V1 / F) TaxID=1149755 RepID=A0A2J6R0H8_HYAVF|nr:FAD/NAD(P)-binding domain-containing protein [Hyaloscypha variabilis F]
MESRSNDLHVLIVGGGSAGLLIAQVLQKVNITCTVFEQDITPFARPRDWNFGIYWAQSRLDECLSDEKRAKIVTVQTDPSYVPSESSVMPVHNGQTGELMKNLPAPWSLRIHRRRWLKMLADGIDIQFGKKLESIERGEESVTITFTDGTKATGNLLIGAEGAHSVVREYLFGAEEAALIPSPVVASVTICKISREASLKLRALHPRYIITFHPNGVFTWMSKDPANWTRMMMQTWRSEEDTGLMGKGNEEVKLKTWYEMGREFGPPFDEIFATMDPKSPIWHNRLGYWPTKPWDGKGPITLAGDAAHPMTFHRGQGLNNAITDAADLLQHLRNMKAPTPLELAAAVKRYEAELVPRGREAVLASNENTNAVHDWATMMDSPLFKGGMAKEGDRIEVPIEKKANKVQTS